MEQCVATIVIEPRLLVREALVSLMASHSYQVVGGVASTADIDNSLLASAPRLVILGPLPADEAAAAADSIRKLWLETKIILLFDRGVVGRFSNAVGFGNRWLYSTVRITRYACRYAPADHSCRIKVLVLKTETCRCHARRAGTKKAMSWA